MTPCGLIKCTPSLWRESLKNTGPDFLKKGVEKSEMVARGISLSPIAKKTLIQMPMFSVDELF